MRLKHVKGAEEAMITSPLIEQEPECNKGRWLQDSVSKLQEINLASQENAAQDSSLAVKPSKLAVEIGMGKGQFIMGMAGAHPDTLFVGIEKYSSVLIRALQKQEERMLSNLRLIRMDAEGIEEIFAPGEVDIIYLNFSDPWPKDRHAKRRLTSPQFLERYKKILKPGGHVEFKTDNMDLFDYSEESILGAGWNIVEITRDLHNDARMSEGNIMTEYEERFSKAGNPIAKVIFKPYN